MIFSKDYYRALDCAIHAHKKQIRRNGMKYVTHPIEVANILMQLGDDVPEYFVIAGLLHDVLEDSNIQFDTLNNTFGEKVASLVSSVSVDRRASKREQKLAQVQLMLNSQPLVVALKLADRLSNIGGHTSSRYSPEYLRHTQEMLDAFRSKTDSMDIIEKVKWRYAIILSERLNDKT